MTSLLTDHGSEAASEVPCVDSALVEEVLPEVPYAPLVLTIPTMLRPALRSWEHSGFGVHAERVES